MAGDDIPQDTLKKLLRYDRETGKLYWRVRSADMFSDGYRNAAGNCANWNARYANTEALSTVSTSGYLYGPVLGKKLAAHRVIFCMEYGYWPENVDHIDGARTHNRLENLRDVTVAENNMNLSIRSDNKTGCGGVHWDEARRKWLVRVKGRHVGRYDVFEEAVAARAAASKQFGFHQNHGRAA